MLLLLLALDVGMLSISPAYGSEVAHFIVIKAPKDKQTFWNQCQINVTVIVKPALEAGNKIELLLDGKLYASQIKGKFTLQNVDRGSHHIKAQLIDEKKEIIRKSTSITIFVHYTRVQK